MAQVQGQGEDETDDGSGQSFEKRIHAGQVAKVRVSESGREHEKKRWQHERERRESGPEPTAEPHGDEGSRVGGNRARQALADREGLQDIVLAHPLAVLHFVLDETQHRHPASETGGTDSQKGERELGNGRFRSRGCRHGVSSWKEFLWGCRGRSSHDGRRKERLGRRVIDNHSR